MILSRSRLFNSDEEPFITLPLWRQCQEVHGFETGIETLFFCFGRHIHNMQILGEFANARMNFTIPVTDLRGD
jgi:hypothetical protein